MIFNRGADFGAVSRASPLLRQARCPGYPGPPVVTWERLLGGAVASVGRNSAAYCARRSLIAVPTLAPFREQARSYERPGDHLEQGQPTYRRSGLGREPSRAVNGTPCAWDWCRFREQARSYDGPVVQVVRGHPSRRRSDCWIRAASRVTRYPSVLPVAAGYPGVVAEIGT